MKNILLATAIVLLLSTARPTHALAQDAGPFFLGGSCQGWLNAHDGGTKYDYGAGVLDGYLLAFVDMQRNDARKPPLSPSLYAAFIRKVGLYCLQRPSASITIALGFVDGGF